MLYNIIYILHLLGRLHKVNWSGLGAYVFSGCIQLSIGRKQLDLAHLATHNLHKSTLKVAQYN